VVGVYVTLHPCSIHSRDPPESEIRLSDPIDAQMRIAVSSGSTDIRHCTAIAKAWSIGIGNVKSAVGVQIVVGSPRWTALRLAQNPLVYIFSKRWTQRDASPISRRSLHHDGKACEVRGTYTSTCLLSFYFVCLLLYRYTSMHACYELSKKFVLAHFSRSFLLHSPVHFLLFFWIFS